MIGEAFEYMARHPVPGVLCEFGVWQGAGLESIKTSALTHLGYLPSLYGFDSFRGMPPTEVPLGDNCKEVWRAGGYADTSLELVARRVPEAILVKGVFCDLAPLGRLGIDQVRFARIDCDIYEGYRDALRLLTPALAVGTVLLFDEVVAIDDLRYQDSIRHSGERAVNEWRSETGWVLEVLHEKPNWTEILTRCAEKK